MGVWVFFPPLARGSGGLMVLGQVARQLHALGHLAGALYWETPPCALDLPWQPARHTSLGAADVLLVPEGWPNALAVGLRAGCRTVVYCQNWAYLFHGLAQGVRWRDVPVGFLAVSDPVAWHMEQVLDRPVPIIRPAIDLGVFHPPLSKPRAGPRIGYMPRKNKALAEQIRRIFEERNPRAGVEWIAIHGLDRQGVAEMLRSCHIFLTTGFPEGCPLPPLEAMACGCLCVGFTGFGGWDYMRSASFDCGWLRPGGFEGIGPSGYRLRPVAWEGNGFWVLDGDTLGASLGIEAALDACRGGKADCVLQQGLKTAEAYSAKSQAREVAAWVATLERGQGIFVPTCSS